MERPGNTRLPVAWTGWSQKQSSKASELVIKLNPTKLKPGDSDTVQLSVTPPNGITPNGAAWSLTPTFQTADDRTSGGADDRDRRSESHLPARRLEEDAPTKARSTSAATGDVQHHRPVLARRDHRQALHDRRLAGRPRCRPASIRLATPAPTEVTGAGPTRSTGSTRTRKLVAARLWRRQQRQRHLPGRRRTSPQTAPNSEHSKTKSPSAGKPIDEERRIEVGAAVQLRCSTNRRTPGELGTNFLSKSSQAPLCIKARLAPRNPSRLLTPAPTPATGSNRRTAAPSDPTPARREGRFEININYPASRAYETDSRRPDAVPRQTKSTKTNRLASERDPGHRRRPARSRPAPTRRSTRP